MSDLDQHPMECREGAGAGQHQEVPGGEQNHPRDTAERVLQVLQAQGGSWRPFSTCTMQPLVPQAEGPRLHKPVSSTEMEAEQASSSVREHTIYIDGDQS